MQSKSVKRRPECERKRSDEQKIFASINDTKYTRHCLPCLASQLIDQLNSNCSTKTMKRSYSKAAMAISLLFGGRSADAFVSRGAISCSPKIQNPNRLITIRSDHMPWTPAASYSSLSACDISSSNSSPNIATSPSIDMCNDKSAACDMRNDEYSSHDFSRREMMDITLGAVTGWILGPRFRTTFAATTSSQDDDIEEMLSKPSED